MPGAFDRYRFSTPSVARRGSNSHVAECGPGEHEHTRYDRKVTDLAVDFLREKSASPDDKPFLLYCGFMHPHFPLIAPPEYYALYDPDTLELPATWNEPLESQHPVIQHHRWACRLYDGLDALPHARGVILLHSENRNRL
ncbi:MAG: sulfatase-like hydrolase/transferase [Candidatus Poribacteria bacterium]|nr:sulfatase-like hydrolase/transferase [Candidatus Poribacteria bacterium]